MAFTEEVLNTYHTYKRCSLGTNAVVQWLCINAGNCGYQLSPPKPTSKSSIKRAKAKAKAKKNPTSNHTIIPIIEYLTLARVITASSEPRVQVPSWLLLLLSDMINVRKIFIKMYASSTTDNDDAPSIAKEASIRKIEILEEVLGVLESLKEKDDYSSPAYLFSEEHTFQENLYSKNSYERLFPDEPIKAGEHWRQCLLPTKSLFLPSADHEEDILRFQCFLEDWNSIRTFLRGCWEAYRRKETDLYAVSVITNTAIQSLQAILLEITEGPKSMDYGEFITLATIATYLPTGIFMTLVARGGERIEWPDWEKLDKFCFPAYSILEKFIRSPHLRYLESCLSRDQPLEMVTEPMERYHCYKSILYHLFGEVYFMVCSKFIMDKMLPCLDMLTKGLYQADTVENIPSWLPFACTIYLDMYEALGTNLEAGKHDLFLSCERTRRSLQDFLRLPDILDVVPPHIPNPKTITKPPEEQQTRSYQAKVSDAGEREEVPIDEHVYKALKLINSITFILNDSIKPAREGVLKSFGWISPKTKPFHLLSIHPLLCGIIDFHFTLRMQETSIQATNDWGAVLSVAYLYKVLQNEVPNGYFSRWQDLEMLSWNQYEEIGGQPRNAEEVLISFQENIGFAPRDFGMPLPPAATAVPLFSSKSQVSSLLFDHYCNGKVLDLAKFKATWRWTRGTFLTPERLCIELALCLKFEFFALKFNILNLHIRCARILHKIHWSLDDKFTARFGEGYIQSPQQLPFLVGYLLEDLHMHGAAKKIRNEEQRLYRIEHKEGSTGSSPNSDRIDDMNVENYESAYSNNEVYEHVSVAEDDVFKDYDVRDPNCAAIVPAFLYQAGELVDVFVSREGDWEHKALESIKDPQKVNPALQEPPLPTMGDSYYDVYNGWLRES